MNDNDLRELGRDLPWDRPDGVRRESVRASLLLAAADAPPRRNGRALARTATVFALGAAAAAAGTLLVVGRASQPLPRAEIRASSAASLERRVVATPTGSEEVVRVHAGTVRIAAPASSNGAPIRVQTDDAAIDGAGDYEVVVEADRLASVAVRAGVARVVVAGQAQPVFLATGETWHAPVIIAEHVVPQPAGAPGAPSPVGHGDAVSPEAAGAAASAASAVPSTAATSSAEASQVSAAASASASGAASGSGAAPGTASASRATSASGTASTSAAAPASGPASASRAASGTGTVSGTGTASGRGTASGSAAASATGTASGTGTASRSASASASAAVSASAAAPGPASGTGTASGSGTGTASASGTGTVSGTGTASGIGTGMATASGTARSARAEVVPRSSSDVAVATSPAAPGTDPRPRAAASRAAIEQHFQAGWQLLRDGKPGPAAIELGEAAAAGDRDPLAVDARYLQAIALTQAGAPREAERAFLAFLDRAPSSLRRGRAAVMLARLIAARGDVASARAWFDSALGDPDPDVAAAARAGLAALAR